MKISQMCAVAALAITGAATAVSAQTVSFASTANNPNSFFGGEFEATFSNGDASRVVFCLERQITFSPNTPYEYTVATGAVSGGPGGNPDPISAATAWIFTEWLGGNRFGRDNQNANVLVQLAIWKLEEEVGPFSFVNAGDGINVSLADVTALINSIPAQYGQGGANGPNATAFSEFANVRALNPTSNNGLTEHQSMIVLIPLPTASGMALAGLALVGGIRRRK